MMISDTIKGKIQSSISKAGFVEATNCHIINQSSTLLYHWYQVYKPPLYMLRTLNEDQFTAISNEIECYKRLITNPTNNKHILQAIPRFIKVGINKNKQLVEILQNYVGIPIIEVPNKFTNQEEPEYVANKIQLMEKILNRCCELLLNAHIIHGELFPENILYELEYDKISFHCGCSLTKIEDLKNFFRPSIINNYNKLFYGAMATTKLDAKNAILADISTLGLSIFEIGFNSKRNYVQSLQIGSDKNAFINAVLSAPNNVLQHQLGNQLKSIIRDMIGGYNGISYEKIINLLTHQDPQSSNYFYPIQPSQVSFKTVIPKTYTKIEKLNQKNKEIYLVYQNPENFIIKLFKEDISSYESEKQVLEYLNSLPAECLVKAPVDIKPEPRELVIQYKGIDLENKSQFIPKKDIFLHIPSLMSGVITDLVKYNLYHGDIKPRNISVDANWGSWLFDYDTSIILESVTTDCQLKFKGITIEYAAPEILDAYLKGNYQLLCNPIKSDCYSLAKTVIFAAHKKFNTVDIINSFYLTGTDNPLKTYNDALNFAKSKIKHQFDITQDLSDGMLILGYFYLENNSLFVENVRNHKDMHLSTISNYPDIMYFLSLLVQTDPSQRLDYVSILSNCKDLIKISIPPYKPLMPLNSANDGWAIEAFENYDKEGILPNIKDYNEIIIPTFDSTHQSIHFSLIQLNSINGKLHSRHLQTSLFSVNAKTDEKYIQYVDQTKKQISLYCIGGTNGWDSLASNFLVDIKLSQLIQKKDMFFKRSEFGVTTSDSMIIVAGGSGGKADGVIENGLTDPLNTIETYKVNDDKWIRLPNMEFGRCNPSLIVTTSNILYVVGGLYPIKYENNSMQMNASPISTEIDKYDLYSSKLLKSGKLQTNIYASISNTIMIERCYHKNEIYILRSNLLATDKEKSVSFYDNDESMCIFNESDFTITQAPSKSQVAQESSNNHLKFDDCSIIVPLYPQLLGMTCCNLLLYDNNSDQFTYIIDK